MSLVMYSDVHKSIGNVNAYSFRMGSQKVMPMLKQIRRFICTY